MKEQIHTIPVNDAFLSGDECPFCFLERQVEQRAINYAVGPEASYMESEARGLTDEEGFCRNHLKMLYDFGNSLGNALILQTYFKIVFPILRPTMISVGILETMWVWNDYLLPTLVLDIKQYRTIPMLIQYFRGSYGRVEMGPMMACIVLTVLPVVVIYLAGQKHIIKGVLAGAVKG